MKLGVMQPYFFPYIGYWQLLNYVDTYIVYDDVKFIKRSWVNRNYILVNNEKFLLTLQLKKVAFHNLINEVEMVRYKTKQLKTITHAYSNAPFFSDIFPLLEELFLSQEHKLSCFLFNSIHLVMSYLGVNTRIVMSSSLEKNNKLRGQEKIIDICGKMNADTYINAIGGQELYNHNKFKDKNIDLYFLKTHDVTYQQYGKNKFIGNLSIIDVLMFNSPKEIGRFLLNFELMR